MPDEKNHAADSGATRQRGGPFDYRKECDEEVLRARALKSHDNGDQNAMYPPDPYAKNYKE